MKQHEKLSETQSAGRAQTRREDHGKGGRKGPTFLDGDHLRRRLHVVAVGGAARGEDEAPRRRGRHGGRGERAAGQGQGARGLDRGRGAADGSGSGHGGGLHWSGAVADGTMRGGSEREARAGGDGDRNEDGKVLWGLCFGKLRFRLFASLLWNVRLLGSCHFILSLASYMKNIFLLIL
jgi:hypothetical protein